MRKKNARNQRFARLPHISQTYAKLGGISTFCLPSWLTCPANLPCREKCYAHHMEQFRLNARDNNLENYQLWLENPKLVEDYIVGYCAFLRYFRWHGSGEIPSKEYFAMMVRVAQREPGCLFLAMTKRDTWVNEWIDQHGALPSNLKIVLSAWGTSFVPDNPHNFPIFDVEFKEKAMNINIPANAFRCGSLGDCAHCLKCWHAQPGDHMVNKEHR